MKWAWSAVTRNKNKVRGISARKATGYRVAPPGTHHPPILPGSRGYKAAKRLQKYYLLSHSPVTRGVRKLTMKQARGEDSEEEE